MSRKRFKLKFTDKDWAIIGSVLFVLSYIGAIITFYTGFMKQLINNGGFFGNEIYISPLCTALSCVFFVVLFVLTIYGKIKNNKTTLIVSAVYQILLVIALIVLTVLIYSIENAAFSEVILWPFAFIIGPVFGVCMYFGILFLILFLFLVITTIVGLVNALKQDFKKKR